MSNGRLDRTDLLWSDIWDGSEMEQRDADERLGWLFRGAPFKMDTEFWEWLELASRYARGLVPNPQLEDEITRLKAKIQRLYDMVRSDKSRALAPVEVEIMRQKCGNGKP